MTSKIKRIQVEDTDCGIFSTLILSI